MREGWEIKKLGEVCEIYQPKTISSEQLVMDGNYPVYGANGIIGRYNQYNHEESEVLVTCRGATCGTINISVPYSWINGNAMVVRPTDISKISKQYLRYVLISVDWKNVITGAAQPQITRQSLSPVPISIPPLPLQEKIVSELDLLSGVIEKKRQQLKELDNLAQSIFYDMLGDPITNEMGWEVKKLGEVCTVNPPKKETSKGLSETDIVSFLPMEDLPIKACYHKPHQTRVFSEVQSSYTCFADNDVLMAKVTPCFENGKIGMASHLINGVGYGSSEFIVIRPNNTDVIKEFIYLFIQDQQFINNAITQFTGTSGLRRVPRQYVENCNIPIPPLPLQQSFAAKVEAIEQQKALIKQSLAETETLFNSRMEYYFGEGE